MHITNKNVCNGQTGYICIPVVAGYNHIITIPSGATEIDIRQHGHNYLADDDNYLGKCQPS